MRWLTWLYEGVMVTLAITVIWLLTMPEQGWVHVANLVIWATFAVDYLVRFARAPDRWRFVRNHIPELIAILPLDYLRVFRLARLARLVRLARAGVILWRVGKDVRGVLGANGLGYVLAFSVARPLQSAVSPSGW